ncbi:MAG: hypothetical protein H0U49_04575 [Parachlamydiaceae bacterium]|nr:hypothetical protein [Parachlamydiaceae bacterium]
MIKEPWKGHSKDSCQKHVDDSHLFTSIRHHTMPFVVPKPQVGEKEISSQKKLEQEIEKKFFSGEYRFADIVKALSMVIKPLFLICVLPFYLGFYLIPTWIYSQGMFLYNRLTHKIEIQTKALKSKITAIFNPLKAFQTKLINLSKELLQRVQSVVDRVKQKIHYLNAQKRTAFLKIRNLWKEVSGYYFTAIEKVKIQWLQLEGKLRSYGKALQKKLEKAIKAPFIYMAQLAKEMSNIIVVQFINPPKQKYLSAVLMVKATHQKIIDRKNFLINTVKERLQIFKAKLYGISAGFRKKGILLKIKSLKTTSCAYIEKVKIDCKNYFKGLKFFGLSSYTNKIKARWESLTKRPKKQFLYIKERIQKCKSDIRQFAIHLPGNIKKQIPRIVANIEKYNIRLSSYLKQGKNVLNNKLETLYALVPSPIRHSITQIFNFFKLVRLKITEKKREVILLFLILGVWRKVIFKYSKHLVTSHQFTKLLKAKQPISSSKTDS